MKKFLLPFLLVFSLLLVIFFPINCQKKEEIKSNNSPKVSNPINLLEKEQVINTFFNEIMRKEEISRIDLVANKNSAPLFYDLCLLIDGVRYPLNAQFRGYQPKLILSDFDNDKLMDLFVSIRTGKTDNSLYIQLFHFKQRKLEFLSIEKAEQGFIPLNITRLSHNKIQIQSKTFRINSIKKLDSKKVKPLSSKLGITPYQTVEVVDIDQDGQSELITKQSIWIEFPHQPIFLFQTVLKYRNKQWDVLEYQLTPVV